MGYLHPGRIQQQQLAIVDPPGWDDYTAPRPGPDASHHTVFHYQNKWDTLVRLARQIGWTPADLAGRGMTEFAKNLAFAGIRDWSPATIRFYAEIATYAGINVERIAKPRHAPYRPAMPIETLWNPATAADFAHPETLRAALCALITWCNPTITPAELLAIGATGTPGGFTPDTGTGTAATPDGINLTRPGGQLLELFRRRVAPWNPTNLMCTTRTNTAGDPPGSPLTQRGLQSSFARHATLNGHHGLTWREYAKHARDNNPEAVVAV